MRGKINLDQMKNKLPKHVAIIMDGNRRWARKHGLDVLKGHSLVTDEVMEPIVDRCIELEIPYLTLWAFSTENWKRNKREVVGLMNLFRRVLNKKMEDLHKKGVKLRVIGDLSRFPKDIREKAQEWIKSSRRNNKITLVLALNYGGRDEIIRALRRVISSTSNIQHSVSSMNEEVFEKYLDTAGMPDPDLVIRTGGSQRMSGFMPWQSVYAEWAFVKTLMPDFTTERFNEVLIDYIKRERRFGK